MSFLKTLSAFLRRFLRTWLLIKKNETERRKEFSQSAARCPVPEQMRHSLCPGVSMRVVNVKDGSHVPIKWTIDSRVWTFSLIVTFFSTAAKIVRGDDEIVTKSLT